MSRFRRAMMFAMTDGPPPLTYHITVGPHHVLATEMCLRTLRTVTDAPVVLVGNVDANSASRLAAYGAEYIDERDLDMRGRMPTFAWKRKFRGTGWYRQMFYRLAIDRYVDAQHVVMLDSEDFFFDNWDERRLFDPDGSPRCFYWVPAKRKQPWEYRVYLGAAYLLAGLAGFEDVMEYANSDGYHRHISGVVNFSTANVAALWSRLERETDLERTLHKLFNEEPDLAFGEFDLYGIAVDYGMFDDVVPTVLHDHLLGWYNAHKDPVFDAFKEDAMWSMCQQHWRYPDEDAYRGFMMKTASDLGRRFASSLD